MIDKIVSDSISLYELPRYQDFDHSVDGRIGLLIHAKEYLEELGYTELEYNTDCFYGDSIYFKRPANKEEL